jgi:hypothetical protein
VDKLVAGLLGVSHCSGVAGGKRSSSAEGNLSDPQSIKHVRFPYLQGCNARTPALGPQYPAKGSIFELCSGAWLANPRSHRKNPGERFSAATIGQAYLGVRVASTVGMNNATHLQVNGVVGMANEF